MNIEAKRIKNAVLFAIKLGLSVDQELSALKGNKALELAISKLEECENSELFTKVFALDMSARQSLRELNKLTTQGIKLVGDDKPRYKL